MSSGGASSPEPPIFSKPAWRRWLRRQRDHCTTGQRKAWSAAASAAATTWAGFADVDLVAVFAPFGSEADPKTFVDWHRRRGGRTVYPRVEGSDLRWFIVTDDTLRPSPPWQIPEPTPGRHQEVQTADIEAWLVPGVGFTKDGLRLGYGRGFYDRALAHTDGPTLGFGFEIQLQPTLPVSAHDVRLRGVVTERGCYSR